MLLQPYLKKLRAPKGAAVLFRRGKPDVWYSLSPAASSFADGYSGETVY
jgi:hypothetical protein